MIIHILYMIIHILYMIIHILYMIIGHIIPYTAAYPRRVLYPP